jgi:hypothetical protein
MGDIMIKFISFGSDRNYIDYSLSLLGKISSRYPDSETKVYSPKDLPLDLLDYSRLESRGFGYWLWKPYIVLEALKELRYGDFLFYVDGRSEFVGSSIEWLDEFVKDKFINKDLCVWLSSYLEKVYTKVELLSFYNLDLYDYNSNSGQFIETFFIVRKSSFSIEFFSKLFEKMSHQKHLLDDTIEAKQYKFFIENRHSQSFFSNEIKNRIKSEYKFFIISDYEVLNSSNTLKPHGYMHPKKLTVLPLYRFSPSILRVFGRYLYINSGFFRKVINLINKRFNSKGS